MKSISFEPIINKNSKVLILGTMPGIKSLEENEYYGNKRNAFWPILYRLFDEEITENYDKKKKFILKHKLALWDTLKLCYREGSLDAKIKNEAPNAIDKLINNYNSINYIIFNGKGSEKFYKRYFEPISEINYITLPSTSPANAQKSFNEKFKEWAIIRACL
jgi:hypoxanthine-DNA glycosylase